MVGGLVGEVCLCSEAAGKSDLGGIVLFRPAELLRTPEKRCPASIPAAAPPTAMPTPKKEVNDTLYVTSLRGKLRPVSL